jgi:hypothetical protein
LFKLIIKYQKIIFLHEIAKSMILESLKTESGSFVGGYFRENIFNQIFLMKKIKNKNS